MLIDAYIENSKQYRKLFNNLKYWRKQLSQRSVTEWTSLMMGAANPIYGLYSFCWDRVLKFCVANCWSDKIFSYRKLIWVKNRWHYFDSDFDELAMMSSSASVSVVEPWAAPWKSSYYDRQDQEHNMWPRGQHMRCNERFLGGIAL